ncbi:MAG: DUF1501 domain-containing protein, partial [Acidobacteriota bacterium]
RGGVDGLNFVPPLGGVDRSIYEAARPGIRIPTSGAGAAISLDGQFGLHPSAAPLFDLYQSQKLSIVHSVGISNLVNKSHFDAMSFVELGTPGEKTTTTGWITRHLASAANLPPELVIPSLAVGDLQPGSLLGNLETLNLADPQSFNIANGPWQWRQAQKDTLRQLYQSDSSWLHDAGSQAIDAIDIVEQNVSGGYTPSNGATYPTGPFGDQLQVLAQMIKLDLGLQVATIDLGGWDTHEGQGGSTGYFADLVDELSRGLAALYADLDGSGASNYTDRMTVVTQSEFGRELYENGDNGTEHGYGGLMMVLSGNATGGIHGTWQGLSQDALVDRTDVAVTTDYRQVLSEILVRRMCNTELETIFPGYTGYQPLGVVDGSDLRPAGIFNDGFDSGNLDAWS